MTDRKVELKNKDRFLNDYTIDREKLVSASQKAADKLLTVYKNNGPGFPGTCSKDYKYEFTEITNWESGMYTGCFWLAYELTGEKEFKDIALSHIDYYKSNIDKKENINDHDVGFMYSPSCVAAYMLTGDEKIREIALRTAEYFYDKSYSKEGKFIIRYWQGWNEGWGCRTMMDSMMNAPFLYWAAKETGYSDYYDAAHQQNLTTEKLLIREDGSSFHHYQFDPATAKPVKGITFQGYADTSCWSRGHSWGVYGFPIGYSYTKDEALKTVHKSVTNFFLNNLPSDLIPYWDFDFKEPSKEYRDSSVGAICACGMLEMANLLSDDEIEKKIYKNASYMLLDAVIDKCTGDIGIEYDGLINHVTHAVPQKEGFDQCAVYGDYFYLEALLRCLKPDWKKYW